MIILYYIIFHAGLLAGAEESPPAVRGAPRRAVRRPAALRVPATCKHGWSKHGFSRIPSNTIGCFDGILLKPCLLQPCFHVAGCVKHGGALAFRPREHF